MGDFYAQLGAGAAPAEALRRAQLAAAASTPHPFYWAPFTYLENSGRRRWRQL
jgi:CHAT domain-containing protein